MDLPTDHPALAVLRSFFAAMNAWEVEAHQSHLRSPGPGRGVDEADLAREALWERLGGIFEQFCEAGKAAGRFQGGGVSFGVPPRYDPEGERIASASRPGDGPIVVRTLQASGMKFSHEYQLVERDGAWLLRDWRRRRFRDAPPWVPDVL